jgi:hypothetical protein
VDDGSRNTNEIMEPTTRFDLNLAIQQWRESLAQSPAFQRENLDELEAHLRDSVAALQARGLSAGEAFMIATRRMGKGGSLEAEFAKVNGRAVWLDRALWMLIGVQVWGLVAGLSGSGVRNALCWGWGSLHPNSEKIGLALPITLFSLAQVLAIASSLVFCWWLIIRNGERLGARLTPLLRRRSKLVATCAGLFLFSLSAYSFNYGMQAFLARSLGVAGFGSATMFASYSQLITWPIQVVTMIVLTLVLARRRLRAIRG